MKVEEAFIGQKGATKTGEEVSQRGVELMTNLNYNKVNNSYLGLKELSKMSLVQFVQLLSL